MRGKVNQSHLLSSPTRITPAYAGKSCSLLVCLPFRKDHPRVCGEKTKNEIKVNALPGSPPRMRGKEEFVDEMSRQSRITPAYAGKSVMSWGFFFCAEDHPRVCGEKTLILLAMFSPPGSPPRMRGKVQGEAARKDGVRITPAYAGKSSNQNSQSNAGKDHPRVCGEKKQLYKEFPRARGSPPRMRGKD